MRGCTTFKLCILVLLLVGISSAQKREANFKDLVQLNGVMYVEGEKKPFSGIAVMNWPSGAVKQKATFVDGVGNGLAEAWHENGKKWLTFTLKKNEREGWTTEWDKTGKLVSKKYFKNGKESKPPAGGR